MIQYNPNVRRLRRLSATARAALLLGAALWLSACGSDEPAADTATTATAPGAVAAKPAATPETAVSDKVSAMSAEELRAAARKAYGENRLYAPAGDNAVEYYLALREKLPGDAAVSSALIDLLPMTVIAIEQSVNREDFAEAQRLVALLEKAEPQHPSLARLHGSIADQQQAAEERTRQQRLTAEQEAEQQAELEAQRRAEQKAQQEAAAQKLVAEQAAEREAAAAKAAQAAEQQRLAEQRASEKRAAQQRAAAAKPTAADLRPLSTPAPEYPPNAYRSRRSGEVQVEFTVGVDGSVTDARVVRSEPARVFDRETLDAVRRWRFQPISAPVTTRRTIGFTPGD